MNQKKKKGIQNLLIIFQIEFKNIQPLQFKTNSLHSDNMKQIPEYQMVVHQNLRHYFFNMIYKVNANTAFKKQTNIVAYIVNIIVNLIAFLSSKQVKLIDISLSQFNLLAYIALFSIFGAIIVQFFVCLIYKIQFYLAIQFKVVRFIIFPVCLNFIFNQIQQDSSNSALFMFLALVFILLVFVLTAFFQSESYTDIQICHTQAPITCYFVIIQVLLYATQIMSHQRIIMLFSVIIMVLSIMIKICFFMERSTDYIEHKILSINSFLYCVYSAIFFLSAFGGNRNISIVIYMASPIILYYNVSQLVRHKIVPLNFKRIFNSDSLAFQEFAVYAQYLIEQAEQFNQTLHSSFCQSLIFTFYSEHQKNCTKSNCKFSADNWRADFTNISDPKTLKKLTQKVVRKLQTLFEDVHKNQPENIQLKFAFIKFYIHTLPNKTRVIQLTSEVQNMNRTLLRDYEVYRLKRLAQLMNNVQVIDNLKTDEQVNQFQRIAYLTINSMMEFWLSFSEEKIDLPKVMNTSQKLLKYKKQMQAEWEKNKNEQKYSTLKIVILYSYYMRFVLNDQKQANLLQIFAKALEQKLLHKKQIKYLSFGSQSALIGASLTDKNLGKIVIANKQASNLFNYSKNEISQIRLNSIMPKIYSEQHDHYLLEFHKDKYKRINADERLLFGKDKFGYIMPILLQLQRTVSLVSQELLFVANIRKYKVRETPLICITDDQGEICDVSSGFKQFFYEKKQKDKQKVQIPTKNVQEIIPTFFEKSQPEDCGNYKFTQKSCSQKYGDQAVQFTVIPISFPLKPNGGYVIMGYRQITHLSLPINYLNITKQIDSRFSKQQLEASKIAYNPYKNRYEIDSFRTKISRQDTMKNTMHTIPFINLQDMTNVFNIQKEEVSYGEKIRTVRLINGGALIRVEINQTFQSQDLSEAQKVNRFQFKIKQLKQQYLQNKGNLLFVTLVKLLIVVIFMSLAAILISQMQFLSAQTNGRSVLLKQLKFRYQVRGYISQYILSFQGLQSKYNDQYFFNKTFSVRQSLVDVLQGANIEQTKKQPMLKTVYLRNQSDLRGLITSQNLSFQPLDSANIKEIQRLWIFYMAILSLFLILQIAIKWIYNQKIQGIYHVFLGVDQKMIKRSYDSCQKFSLMLEDKNNDSQKQMRQRGYQFDGQNQNPVSKMKKYKQNSDINVFQYIKYCFSFVIMLVSCVIIYDQMGKDVQNFNNKIWIFKSVYGLFPQSSIALMNTYFKSYKQNDLKIQQSFNLTYQQMDEIILEFQAQNLKQFGEAFFQTLMNDACKTSLNSLSSHYGPLCSTIQESIFITGVGKVTNHIAGSIQNLNKNSQTAKNFDKLFFDLYQLEYDFYVPIISKLSSLAFEHMVDGISGFENKYKIWMGAVTLIIAINAFYIYKFLLKEIKQQIELAKQLLYIIPDNFNEQKTSKFRKKQRTSTGLQQSTD